MKVCIPILSMIFSISLISCSQENASNSIHFATAAQYPPFEYKEKGVLKGYDIDLAKLVAKELGKEAVFDDMQFSVILPALTSHQADAAISTITITDERKKNFDFTEPYYFEGVAAVFKKESPIQNASQLNGKKVAAQLGSTMEIWLKKHAEGKKIMSFDNNNQAIEALKAGHVDVVLLDGAQGAIFSGKSPNLSYVMIAEAEDGYGIALPKHSPLTQDINQALNALKEKGLLKKLQEAWFGESP